MEQVRQRRISLGISQSELAFTLGKRQVMISLWEQGKKVPERASEEQLLAWLSDSSRDQQ